MTDQISLAVFVHSTTHQTTDGMPSAAAALFAWPLVLIAAMVAMRSLRLWRLRSKVRFVYSGGRSRTPGRIIKPVLNARSVGPIPIRPGSRRK